MNSQHEQFLNLKTFPARLRVEEAALLLGFSLREMPILAAGGMLKPLGHPPITGVKYYSTAALEELRRDEKWLAKASDYIVQYWQNMNQKRREARKDQSSSAPARNRVGFKRQFQSPASRSERRFENAVE